ncbi:MAG: hypothetical protein PHE51_04670 [Eubacteriales bacterium]|nr:hypothetical protein [Eubacteriales bacterium]
MENYHCYPLTEDELYNEGNVFCCVCGKQITGYEKSYSLGNETVCDDEGCKDEFYDNNADEMLVEFAKETGMRTDAMEWFYENI